MEMIPVRPTPTPVTDREAMAKANIAETEQAHKLAAERRAQDFNEPPLINTLAESIKEKLQSLPKEGEENSPNT